MSAVITRVVFNERDFPMSPHMESYAAREVDGQIVFFAKGLKHLFNQYSDELCAPDRPTYESLAEGEYTLFIGLEGKAEDPVIVFEFENNETGFRFNTHKLRQQEYLNQFAEYQGLYGFMFLLNENSDEAMLFEKTWSIQYLQDVVFEQKLMGSEDFWHRFYGQLDLASVPISIKMGNAQQGDFRPIVCEYAGLCVARY